MSALKCWVGGALMLFALAQGSHAEMSVSQSNDPAVRLDDQLTALFGQERASLGALDARDVTAPVVPVSLQTGPSDLAQPALPAPKPAGIFSGLFQPRKPAAVSDALFTESWLARQPLPAKADPDLQCLATALYFEARGESLKGQAAVAEVILNRVESPAYPRTICGVVNQRGAGGCQFSYTCDGRSDRVSERGAWQRASKVAAAMLNGASRELTGGATHFHTPSVRPDWSRRFTRTAAIGGPIFYRQPVRTAMN